MTRLLCEHAWSPLPTWSARYRCGSCGAIGYRGIVNQGETSAPGRAVAIIPYRCTRKDCHRLAVKRKPQVCTEHR
jgi:hypothetical protein